MAEIASGVRQGGRALGKYEYALVSIRDAPESPICLEDRKV